MSLSSLQRRFAERKDHTFAVAQADVPDAEHECALPYYESHPSTHSLSPPVRQQGILRRLSPVVAPRSLPTRGPERVMC